MSLIKKIFGKKLNHGEKRSQPRKHLKEFFKIQLTINGSKFRIHDFSSSGIGLINESENTLSVGKTYSADLMAYGLKRCQVKLKVIRKNNELVGCEILDRAVFSSFEKEYLQLASKP